MKKQLMIIGVSLIFLVGCRLDKGKINNNEIFPAPIKVGEDKNQFESLSYTNSKNDSNIEMSIYLYPDLQWVSLRDFESTTGRKMKLYYNKELDGLLDDIAAIEKICSVSMASSITTEGLAKQRFVYIQLTNGDSCSAHNLSNELLLKLAELVSEIHDTGEDEPIFMPTQ
ncbi:MAG: hypothetical protein H6623_08355 [Bdellovibrionaceae bacterium]|nr:hypothetical protein [Pseudobdellovibrionaceae bacterium]